MTCSQAASRSPGVPALDANRAALAALRPSERTASGRCPRPVVSAWARAVSKVTLTAAANRTTSGAGVASVTSAQMASARSNWSVVGTAGSKSAEFSIR